MAEDARIVCRTDRLYHYLFNPKQEVVDSIVSQGLRPLSDFPESERWREIQTHRPGFFEWLYRYVAEPVLQKPYTNSGVFVTPIDFRLLPQTFLYDKPRVTLPLKRFDPEWACLTYMLDDERISLPLEQANLESAATLWTADRVRRWFAVDSSRVFFYVPQVATYQPGGVKVYAEDVDDGKVSEQQ